SSSCATLATLSYARALPRPPVSPPFPYTTLFRSRYLLDAVARRGNSVAELLLRDSCPRNVTEGSRMIEERGLASLARFENANARSEEHTSELQSRENLVCRLLLEKKK